jgi:CRISPR-associated endonuclease Cas1/CRISPR-associated protein Cas4
MTPELLPVRMLNEFVYCPRLAYLEWVHAEWADSADTVEGRIVHRRVDQKRGELPQDTSADADETIHARSLTLASETLGIIARLDLVEAQGQEATPVDYKRGKRPHVPRGAYDPERVQLCAQGLLLQEHGYQCQRGILYYAGSRERVWVELDDDLVRQTQAAIQGLRELSASETPPPPLEDSPKCPRCSLVGICLPDEVRFLTTGGKPPRPIFPANPSALPVYVQSPRAWLRKDGERIIVEEDKKTVAEIRLGEVSHVVLFGASAMSTPLLHELMRREIPVSWHTYGGWFVGHTSGLGHRNAAVRAAQYRASFDPATCLCLARSLVAAKIANCRTLLRRNWRADDDADGPAQAVASLRNDIQAAQRARSLEALRGIEGTAASTYFQHFSRMLRKDALTPPFDFSGRNRRPPRDPVNALLSFAYAMLTRQWHITLAAVGLDPYRGFYHQPRFGKPALALDMMEPMRPLIADSATITALNTGEVQAKDFLFSASGCALTESGRKSFIATFERRLSQEVTHPLFGYRISYRRLLEVQARLLIRFLTGEIPNYPEFRTR